MCGGVVCYNKRMKKIQFLICVVLMLSVGSVVIGSTNSNFRVTPYLQHPATNAISLLWVTSEKEEGFVSWWEESEGKAGIRRQKAEVVLAEELSANLRTPVGVPWKYRTRITGLKTGTRYGYRVECGSLTYENSFKTAPERDSSIRVICYSDSETEPQSTGACVAWEDPEDESSNRRYLVDQTTGYASNIVQMIRREPDLILISGDLVECGSKQEDWDEFWRHNAGAYNDPAGSIPILAAPGNHEYNDYFDDNGEAGMRKYLSYFEFEPNGTSVEQDQQERFHRLDYGPATFLFLDLNNGPNEDPLRDPNVFLDEKTSRAPFFTENSEQWKWLEAQLKEAQEKSKFTFVFSHHCPYSVGYHGRINGEKGKAASEEYLSGTPARILQPILMKYGVTAWICGHDEIFERSEVVGMRVDVDGTERQHTLQIYDVGFSGDGLRGRQRTEKSNPFEKFRAHVDSPEVWKEGVLVDGGKHYGHLELNISTNSAGKWEVVFTPVYCFVSKDKEGKAVGFERRIYDDVITIESDR